MIVTMIIVVILLASVITCCLYFLLRNNMVLNVRCWFLEDHYDLYEELGEYSAMLYGLKVQHLWTKMQWLNYVKEK